MIDIISVTYCGSFRKDERVADTAKSTAYSVLFIGNTYNNTSDRAWTGLA